MFLTRIESFSSAHQLKTMNDDDETNVTTKCSNIHGHNYKIEITLKGIPSTQTGMLMDAKQLKKIIWKDALLELDHKMIDEIPFFLLNKIPSTCENINYYLWTLLHTKIPLLYSIKLWETDSINTKCYREDFEASIYAQRSTS